MSSSPRTLRTAAAALSLSAALVACGSETDPNPSTCTLPTLPTAYASPQFAVNATVSLVQIQRFDRLRLRMDAAEKDPTIRVSGAELQMAYEAGLPSLWARSSDAFRPFAASIFDEFGQADGLSWTPAEPPPMAGGRFGGPVPAPATYYVFEERGGDLRQLFEKAAYGALDYYVARSTIAEGVTAARLDTVLALFGAHPRTRASDGVSFAAFDRDGAERSAIYAKRRDDPTAATGMLREVQRQLLTAQAAVATEGCAAQAQAAVDAVFVQWERALAATVVYYARAAKAALTKDGATEKELAVALHGISEAAGMAYGFRLIPQTMRVANDLQLDAVLAELGMPNGAERTTYRFVTDTVTEAPKLDRAVDAIAAAYGFSAAELDAFGKNN
jgi:hypothetical protein